MSDALARAEVSAQAPDPRPRPLDHLALTGARHDAALIDRHGTLDHLGLERAVGALARALASRGLAPGERVASWLAKTRLACLLPLACARAGLVYVPVNPLLKRRQVAHILADSGARLLFAGEGRAATLEAGDRPADCALLIEDEAVAATLQQQDGLPPSSAVPDALAALLYTSGSTGRPKGVMLSHANLWLGAVAVAHYLRLSPADRVLAVLPLAFDYGQSQLLSTWAAGAAAIPLDYLTPRDVVRAVERHGVTTLAGVPPLWVQLAEVVWSEAAKRSLRRLTNSGGVLPVPLVRRLRELFPDADLYAMYGLTEAFRSTFLDPALIDTHPDAIGRAIPFAEVMVVDDDGSPVSRGELVHAGPLVAQGYWRDPVRTAARFRPAPDGASCAGPAVWSGDIVERGGDGLLRFVGRDDEMIKVSGNRLSPNEIEEVATGSGLVSEAVAIGVPDERQGEAIVLVARGSADKEALLFACLKRELPGFMLPRTILWRETLPRNANGKLDRAALRAEIRA